MGSAKDNTAKAEFKAAWDALKARTTPEQTSGGLPGDEHPGRGLTSQACLHYLRMRRAMLSVCWESRSRLLTSLATEWRDKFGCSFQMASASAPPCRPGGGRPCEVACLLQCGGLVLAVHVKSNQRIFKKLPPFPDADDDRQR